MLYTTLYYLHICAVIFSGSFFLLRGIWMLGDNPILGAKFVKISPHVNDTILLAAAIGLAVMTGQYPLTHDWLTVKVVALIVYILLGVFALRAGSRPRKIGCFVAALLVFGFMVSVAMTRHPMGVFSL